MKDGAPNTAAVATYVGTDPERDTISWDLRGADAALFTIDGGVLKFRALARLREPEGHHRAPIRPHPQPMSRPVTTFTA